MLLDYDLDTLAQQALNVVGSPVCLLPDVNTAFCLIYQELFSERLSDTELTTSSGLVSLQDADLFSKGSTYYIKAASNLFAEVRLSSVPEKDPPLFAKLNLELVAWRTV